MSVEGQSSRAGVSKLRRWAKSGPLLGFANKVLLERTHAYLFVY